MAGPQPDCPSSFDTLTFIVYESAPFEQAVTPSAKIQQARAYLLKKLITSFTNGRNSLSYPCGPIYLK